MKRKVLAVLLAASMMGTLGACGSSDSGKQTDAKTDDSSSTETTDSGEASADSSDGSFDGVKIEVDIEDSIQGDQNTLDCFNKLIDEFSQQTGAEVEVVQNGSDHENIMKTRMASQDMPDMFVTHGWSTLRYNDFFEDLSGEEWVSRLDDAVKAVITDENGKVCTAPLTQWVYGMVYNADVLEANDIDPYAIKTWDDFKAACEKLEANGTTPLVISGKNGSTLTGTMEQLNSFYTIDGAPYESREALKDGSFDFTKNTQFLDLYAELYDNGWFNEDIFTADQTTQFKYLGSGDYGFIPWGSPANIQTMKTYTPDVNFGIIPVPAVEEGGNAAYTVGEGSCLAISNTSENIDCCKALLNFLLEKDNLTEYCTANGGMPGLSDVTPEDSESLELYKKSVEAAGDNITYSNFFDREYLPSGMWNVMQETMAKLYNGEVGTAKDRVAEAASYFQENYKTLLGTNG